jgi:flagellin
MRISPNLHANDLLALTNLNKVYNQMNIIATQLATGLRINRGSDDPAGMVAAEVLQMQLASVEQASNNASSAQQSLDVADAGMTHVADLLNSIRANVVAASGTNTSPSQRAALQQQVDAALKQIDSIGANTSFAGQKLLNGSTLKFQLSPNLSQSASVQMPNVSTSALGGQAGTLSDLASGGKASLQSGDLQKAQSIVDDAENQIMSAQAKTAAFEKYSVQTAQANLNSMQLNMTVALSEVRDTDMAQAITSLIRTKILGKSLVNVVRANLKTQGLVLDILK